MHAQARMLDDLFAMLASQDQTSNQLDVMEWFLRLVIKSHSPAIAALRALAEIKARRQVTYLVQANLRT